MPYMHPADGPRLVLPELYQDGAEPGIARTGPVFTRRGNRLAMQCPRYQIQRGHQAAGKPLTPAQTNALDAFDEALADESRHLRLPQRRGNALILDSRRVFHGRTACTDHPDPPATPPHPSLGRLRTALHPAPNHRRPQLPTQPQPQMPWHVLAGYRCTPP
ncbi:TauD/TfdA family dioxygenase [Streptomyces microflavus]|uniref:TauD/TfdA family dioxygenase n=1 Tax=Streptomyces microflavus TaxID=1919 RepID=A0A7H8MYC0_STRMI|nr:TauD/TfdA family dioxygenase [Streptomyces microflavus]